MTNFPDVTVVIPVLNEEQMLPDLILSLENQTLRPVEVIVVDGGSTDGTCDWVRERAQAPHSPFVLRLLEVAGARPGGGRNAGAEAAQSEIIACSDCGVDLDPQWLEHLVAELVGESAAEFTIGSFVGRGQTPFERCVADLVIRRPNRVKLLYSGGVSVAFFRETLRRLGGYAEDVYPCEDALLLRTARDSGIKIARVPKAITYWRPRGSLKAVWKQYRSYAWGDAMIQIGLQRHLLRFGFYALSLGALLCWPAPWIQLSGALLLACYLLLPVARVWWHRRERSIWFWGPQILLTKDLAQMSGYLAGHWNRLRGGSRDYGRRGRTRQPATPQPAG